jgi:GcrA cell cycle regulator
MNQQLSREDMIRAARAASKSQNEMAALIGHSRGKSINYWINKLGLPKFGVYTKHSPERVEEIKTLWADGNSLTVIGEKLSMTRGQVVGILKRNGCLTKRKTKQVKERVYPARTHRLKTPPEFKRDRFSARTAPVEPLHIPFMDLAPHHCREPYGDEPRDFTYCGHPVAPGRSYCPHHAAINYAPPVARNRNPRPRA